ncbi:redoxin domain-containing protein [Vulgatibacter sp.]|uniref:redoxin domain-containing protein n=1 Tax=Vulgatibacter sp. TaxID=1971226 RepID=UPI003569D01F
MALKLRTPMPDLTGATEWLHGDPISADSLKGHVTLVHFWAVSCGICKPHLPTINEWKQKYEGQGVRFVSIHMPRQEADTDVAAVKKAIEEYAIRHPTAVDNMHGVTDAFQNEYVPAYYVFDQEGQLRCYMSGEKVLPGVQQTIDRLLGAAQQTA